MWKATAVCCALVLAGLSAHAQEQAGQVLFVAGDAARVPADGKARKLARGDAVFEGDMLRTGSGAHLQLAMSDDAFLALRPGSQVRVRRYGERAFFELVEGALRSITGAIGRRDRSHYRIEAPFAVLGIRGTDHETRVVRDAPGAGTYNRVTLGGTYIETRRARIDLDPGQTGFVPLHPDAVPARLEETPEFLLAVLPPPAPDTGPRGLQRAPGLHLAPGLDRAPGLPRSQAPALLLEHRGTPGEVLRRQGTGKIKN